MSSRCRYTALNPLSKKSVHIQRYYKCSLGNNDLEKGSTKLSPLLEHLETTVLASNVIINSEEAKQKIQKSVIINFGTVNVGLTGYLTPESNLLDVTDNVEYIDEVIALQEEVNKLKSQGVNIIIALGHSEFDKNKEIAYEVDGLDLIISGHKNAYFWNGTNSEGTSRFEKESVVTQKSGKQVPVVESYSYDKYFGKFLVKFDANGEIVEYKADPILLDASIHQNEEVSKIIQKYNKNTESRSEVIGTTVVALDGESCRLEECNFANLVLDSMVHYYAIRFEGERWTDAPIAIANSGTFATTIAPTTRPSDVTRLDLTAAIPESENLVVVTMNGTILMEVLEHSVSDFRWSNPSGQFLQFSGIRVVYDLANEPGSRISSVVARCWSCYVPEFYTIDDFRDYKIIMPSSLANGEDGYSMLANMPRETLSYDAITCVAEYIEAKSPVYPEVAGRITLLNTDDVPSSASSLSLSVAIFLPALLSYLFTA